MDLFDELIGEQLSAVTFVQDYFQLWFDGPGINVTNPTTIKQGDKVIISWSEGFRDSICAQITKVVTKVELKENVHFRVVFRDNSFISVSLKLSDYNSPEAIYAHGFVNKGWVVL